MASDSATTCRFSVALSFPGEYREFMRQVAGFLADAFSQEWVLYDHYHDAEFSRSDLHIYLPTLYGKESELIVIFLCADYASKPWCKLEWRHISQLISSADAKRIMFFSFGELGDMSDLGILPGDSYIDIQQRHLTPQRVAEKIIKRFGINQGVKEAINPLSLDPARSGLRTPEKLKQTGIGTVNTQKKANAAFGLLKRPAWLLAFVFGIAVIIAMFVLVINYSKAAGYAYAKAEKTAPKIVERLASQAPVSTIVALAQTHASAKDYKKAAEWYENAARQGDAEAQYSLGKLYETGNGVTTNIVKARSLFKDAASQGHEGAARAMEQIKIMPVPTNPVHGSLDIEMVAIPEGEFWMGSADNDETASNNEKPRHKVMVQAFSLGKYEVTQGQWKAVMGFNPSKFQECGENCPVEGVSFYVVQKFIEKLNALTGITYRLPTEAEWEYACRAGEDSLYCDGDNPDSVAWYGGNSLGTHPVGQKQPNALGLHDMSGNVWEWTCSAYTGHYGDGSESLCAEGDHSRLVVRGGSWSYSPQYLRSAVRDGGTSVDAYIDRGFRLARD